eukprot:4018685-Prymnesium_polylepis.1
MQVYVNLWSGKWGLWLCDEFLCDPDLRQICDRLTSLEAPLPTSPYGKYSADIQYGYSTDTARYSIYSVSPGLCVDGGRAQVREEQEEAGAGCHVQHLAAPFGGWAQVPAGP